jgi:hypothetical protein
MCKKDAVKLLMSNGVSKSTSVHLLSEIGFNRSMSPDTIIKEVDEYMEMFSNLMTFCKRVTRNTANLTAVLENH